MKIALIYDRINKWGGAESVISALHELYPEAPLFTSVYDKNGAPWAKSIDVHTSFLQNLPLPKNKHEYYPFLMGIAFEAFNFDDFDVVISVTHEFAKAIITKPKTLHVCYCLTPTSYLWSGYDAYFAKQNAVFKALTYPLIAYMRWYDKIVANRPDYYIAISKVVQDRIQKYYGFESDLIYPPVTLGELSKETGDYFLIVSRLVPNKRIDIAVEAFNKLGLPLVIIGKGREEQKLKQMANSNIKFLGHLTDSELARYYKQCLAFVLPGIEDFGITPVEAQSYGKPVIAFKGGGAWETIIEGKTGFFFDHQTVGSLTETIKSVNLQNIKPEDCIKNAKNFSKEKFKRDFKEKIERLYALRTT